MGRPEVTGKSENSMTNRKSCRRVLEPDPGVSSGGWP